MLRHFLSGQCKALLQVRLPPARTHLPPGRAFGFGWGWSETFLWGESQQEEWPTAVRESARNTEEQGIAGSTFHCRVAFYVAKHSRGATIPRAFQQTTIILQVTRIRKMHACFFGKGLPTIYSNSKTTCGLLKKICLW